MKRALALFILPLCIHSTFAQARQDLTKYVNPFIGTQKMGHTYPGATVPFGSVQLSPDTDEQPYNFGGPYNKDAYKYCAGYQYDDREIVGFSHTHFSGTGHSDLGDFLIMPTTGDLQLEPGKKGDPRSGFRSAFSHDIESAEPGYYKVKLDDHNILAEMTASSRVGFHQYTFLSSPPARGGVADASSDRVVGANSRIILDLMHGIYNHPDKNVWTYVRVVDDRTIVGYRQTSGWARTRTVYFAMKFSKPFSNYGFKNFAMPAYVGHVRRWDQFNNFPEMMGKQIRAYFDFETVANEKMQIKFALSPVSMSGAMANMQAEIPHWDFERVRREGQAAWNRELSRVSVEATSRDDLVNFYTAMYHSLLAPTVYQDVDGKYKGLDQEVHTAKGFTNYTTFSLWDTYRAQHPLLNIIQPARNRDMVRSMLGHYDQSPHKLLPIWSHYANENFCMMGYHSVSVIADAIVKGNTAGIDTQAALNASITTATNAYFPGLDSYRKLGYTAEDKSPYSVSKTLEYAYDDWAIAQAAKKLGSNSVYEEFLKRSRNWRNVYDPAIGFMRPRLSDGKFRADFDPLKTHDQGFIEGNAWNYGLYVPHEPEAMIEMMGGKKKFAAHLDELFTMNLPDQFFAETEDITREGIIGNYVHGNEPSHHIAYLYNWTDEPWKTQQRVRMILKNQYRPTPDGLGGNDDCGQMSAWFIFSSLGFYPVTPGSDRYYLGSPAIKSATLKLENGRSFTVEALNQSEKNVYVSKVILNGKLLNRRYITHSEILGGGKLTFHMTEKPFLTPE
jgi:predicted alpha-1,2-mannosidase